MANKTQRAATSSTEALKILWEAQFFRTWKKKGAIEAHLNKAGYNFSGPDLGMALVRARHLTRRGKQGSYEYVQKYPFVPKQAERDSGKR